jgi:integrase
MKEIDFDARLWTLPGKRAKNSIEHSIPLSDQAIEILKTLPRIAGSNFVFTINGRNPVRGTHRAKRRIDKLGPSIPPWVLHDIRRTVASGMARLGANLPVIEKLLNHVSGSFAGIVGVYQRHSFADEKGAAMTAWARHTVEINKRLYFKRGELEGWKLSRTVAVKAAGGGGMTREPRHEKPGCGGRGRARQNVTSWWD